MVEVQKNRLNSWKEIAQYLGREVRTVSQWEKDKGLPVHRIPGGKRKAVFAYPDEIDRWLLGANIENGDESRNGAPAVTDSDKAAFLNRVPARVRIAAVAVITIVIVASVFFGSKQSAPGLSTASLENNRLVARSDDNQIRWSYLFPIKIMPGPHDFQRVKVADVDNDGRNEIVAAVSALVGQNYQETDLYCFSSDGKVRWHLRLNDVMSFGKQEFGPPWRLADLIVYDSLGQKRIAWAAVHHIWWPGILSVLDESGQLIGKFINSGWITTLISLEKPSGALLLAGGVSNAHNAGMMAVLDEKQISGTSPDPIGTDFECKNCSKGKPLRYFVFPFSEFNKLANDEPNRVAQIDPTATGISVHTLETNVISMGISKIRPVEGIYEFTSDFELKHTRFSDSHKALHRQLEAEGKVDHSLENCPERNGPVLVRSWDPKNGWTDLRP